MIGGLEEGVKWLASLARGREAAPYNRPFSKRDRPSVNRLLFEKEEPDPPLWMSYIGLYMDGANLEN